MKDDIVDQLLYQWGEEHPNKDVSALGVIVRIQMLGKLLQRQTATALAKHGLKHWEYDVLSVLRRQGAPFEMAATDIARAALLTTGAMTTRIDGLEARGLVRRRKSKTDGRSIPVRLTAKGKRLVDFAIDTRIDDANKALTRINDSDTNQLAAGLRRLLLQIDQ
jgi:DNA-binding MarR family transcriptional regulator